MRAAIRSGRVGIWVLVALATLSPSGVARAGGLELLPGGTRSAARGGAVAARPEDGMAMLHDPAGLAFLPRDQFMLDIDISQQSMCVDLYGYYGWGVYEEGSSRFGDQTELDDPENPTIGATYATTPLPEICNSAPIFPIPQIAWTTQLGQDFTLGIGFVAPSVVTGLRWGGADGTIDPDAYDDIPERPDGTKPASLPSPTRYQMIEQKIEGFAPNVGFGYRVLPQLALGANLQLVMLRAKGRSIQNEKSGTQPSLDWLAEVEAEDFFLPSITFSAHVRPMRGLDVVGAFRWVDTFNGDGKAVYTTNTFQSSSGATGNAPVPFENDSIKLSNIEIGLPWAATLAVRYAGLLPDVDEAKRAETIDPMRDELWDVELDATYNFNARSSKASVQAAEDITVILRNADGSGESVTVTKDELEAEVKDSHQKDSIALRLGGSYSVLPRQLSVHAGTFFETRGIDPAYASIDSFAFQRFGVSGGLIWRLGDFDLLAGYTHIFQETLLVAPPPHQNLEDRDRNTDDPTVGFDQRVGADSIAEGRRTGGVLLEDPDAPSPGEADAVAHQVQERVANVGTTPERVINAGKYTAAFNILSIGAIYHF